MIPLTSQAHELVRAVLKPGDIAIDATAGNGHDTQFLAECVGPTGTVYSFDIQESAVQATARRLASAGLENVTLILRNHAEMRDALPTGLVSNVAAIMFNLGYLPGGDKQLVTKSDSTLAAIQAALLMMAPSGIMTIIAYPGHAGGDSEARQLQDFLNGLAGQIQRYEPSPATNSMSPRLFIVSHGSLNPDLTGRLK